MNFREHLGGPCPVHPERYVKRLRFDRTETDWSPAFMVDWKWIKHHSDVIGYREAGPIRQFFLELRAKLQDQ